MCVRKYATEKISGILKKKIKTISEMEARTASTLMIHNIH